STQLACRVTTRPTTASSSAIVTAGSAAGAIPNADTVASHGSPGGCDVPGGGAACTVHGLQPELAGWIAAPETSTSSAPRASYARRVVEVGCCSAPVANDRQPASPATRRSATALVVRVPNEVSASSDPTSGDATPTKTPAVATPSAPPPASTARTGGSRPRRMQVKLAGAVVDAELQPRQSS